MECFVVGGKWALDRHVQDQNKNTHSLTFLWPGRGGEGRIWDPLAYTYIHTRIKHVSPFAVLISS